MQFLQVVKKHHKKASTQSETLQVDKSVIRLVLLLLHVGLSVSFCFHISRPLAYTQLMRRKTKFQVHSRYNHTS